jgi:hypothetical protein
MGRLGLKCDRPTITGYLFDDDDDNNDYNELCPAIFEKVDAEYPGQNSDQTEYPDIHTNNNFYNKIKQLEGKYGSVNL